jgi:hypothetical protein
VPAAALLGALVAALLVSGCGNGVSAATSSSTASPSATAALPVDGDTGPPKSPGGVCERTTADRKSLPSWARITVERFVVAVDAGDRAAMRALFDPAGAAKALADLRPVARLGLLALEDRY